MFLETSPPQDADHATYRWVNFRQKNKASAGSLRPKTLPITIKPYWNFKISLCMDSMCFGICDSMEKTSRCCSLLAQVLIVWIDCGWPHCRCGLTIDRFHASADSEPVLKAKQNVRSDPIVL